MTEEENLDLYFHENRFIGELPLEKGVYAIELGSQDIGFQIKIFLKMNLAKQIAIIRYKIYADQYTIALMAYLATLLENQDWLYLENIDFSHHIRFLGIPLAFRHGTFRIEEAFKKLFTLLKEDNEK